MVLGPAAGRLLIATGGLADPNFSRTVVLLLDHDSTGTLGVVLNRPTTLPVAEALPSWAGLIGPPPSVLFQGGPLGLDSALALATLAAVPVDAAAGPVGWRGVVGSIGMIDLDVGTDDLGPALRELRVYAGYSGWGPGQLDAELAGGAWIVVDSEPGDAFCADPDKLWSRVWRRQPGERAFVSTRPEDPTQN
jgi:putative transcriptional regulator